jgi:hypothetical protein
MVQGLAVRTELHKLFLKHGTLFHKASFSRNISVSHRRSQQLVPPVTGRSHSACDSICALSDRRPAVSYRLHPSGACPSSSLENPDGRGRRQIRIRGPAIWPSGRPRGRPHAFFVPFPAPTSLCSDKWVPHPCRHSERSEAESKDLRLRSFLSSKFGCPILATPLFLSQGWETANFIVLALFPSARQVGPTADGRRWL